MVFTPNSHIWSQFWLTCCPVTALKTEVIKFGPESWIWKILNCKSSPTHFRRHTLDNLRPVVWVGFLARGYVNRTVHYLNRLSKEGGNLLRGGMEQQVFQLVDVGVRGSAMAFRAAAIPPGLARRVSAVLSSPRASEHVRVDGLSWVERLETVMQGDH
jgi:hypothetical protein